MAYPYRRILQIRPEDQVLQAQAAELKIREPHAHFFALYSSFDPPWFWSTVLREE
jgi:hypothetical protein